MTPPNLTLRFPEELREPLEALADDMDRPLAYVIRMALHEWLRGEGRAQRSLATND